MPGQTGQEARYTMNTKPMSPDDLATRGRALYGERWQTPLAHDLGVADRTVRRWLAGETAIPGGVDSELRKILESRWNTIGSMSFESHGFLSPDMDVFKAAVRGRLPTKPWFELADGLNHLALDILNGHETPLDDNQRLLITALFVRVHKAFQSGLILAERGLTTDANAVLRSGAEGAIALHALADDPVFVQKLIGAHQHNQQKLARVVLDDPDYRSTYPAAQITRMQATIDEVDTAKKDPSKFIGKISWEAEAKKCCPDLYKLLYRLLSTNGTHINLDAVHAQLETDSSGRITALKVGTDSDGLVETIKSACLILLWATDPFLRAFPKDGFEERVKAGIARVDELLGNLPI